MRNIYKTIIIASLVFMLLVPGSALAGLRDMFAELEPTPVPAELAPVRYSAYVGVAPEEQGDGSKNSGWKSEYEFFSGVSDEDAGAYAAALMEKGCEILETKVLEDDQNIVQIDFSDGNYAVRLLHDAARNELLAYYQVDLNDPNAPKPAPGPYDGCVEIKCGEAVEVPGQCIFTVQGSGFEDEFISNNQTRTSGEDFEFPYIAFTVKNISTKPMRVSDAVADVTFSYRNTYEYPLEILGSYKVYEEPKTSYYRSSFDGIPSSYFKVPSYIPYGGTQYNKTYVTADTFSPLQTNEGRAYGEKAVLEVRDGIGSFDAFITLCDGTRYVLHIRGDGQ